MLTKDSNRQRVTSASHICTIYNDTTNNTQYVSHDPYIDLIYAEIKNPPMLMFEYNIFKELQEKYPDSPYFIKPYILYSDTIPMYHMYNTTYIDNLRSQRDVKLENFLHKCSSKEELSEYVDNEEMLIIQKWQYIIDIANGIKLLHDEGIIHRNLCSRCISINNGVATITDLSSCAKKMIDGKYEPNVPPMFGGHYYIGHPYYVVSGSTIGYKWTAPEAQLNTTKFSVKSDAFAFGMLISEIYGAMCPAFQLGVLSDNDPHYVNFSKLIWRYQNDWTPDISRYYSKDIMPIIKQCISPNPDQRPLFDDNFIKKLVNLKETIKNSEIVMLEKCIDKQIEDKLYYRSIEQKRLAELNNNDTSGCSML
ncbi:MAG: TKL protein kinase [Homavirus sp.]|uniref:TKL protein kinase n=1 Tax=Homavirus sp. TaxID=2487769 RepID=A0A3G5A4F0_9VIRU|nr:MAG: TKL protein kinase [Homavirus sp.]